MRLFLNVSRAYHDERSAAELLYLFGQDFRINQWPGARLPEVFYDPRALERTPGPRACLHAKCVVVDGAWAFVTSANLTEAAQERNIEAGILVSDRELSRSLIGQFESLVQVGALRRLPGF